MNSRNIACLVAAGFLGVGLVSAATHAGAASPPDVTVQGGVNPATQRAVYFGDLNLALRPAQIALNHRIRTTASNLCWDLNGYYENDVCTRDAVRSTDSQVAAAIGRAERQMAGLPVGPTIAISMVIGAR